MGTSGDADPTITLEYFCLRGLGELPRLILEVTGTPYHNVFHFMQSKYKEYAPFGQLPVLRDGDLLLVQSGAIVRHLARKTCIDGVTLADKAKVDMYYELAVDIRGKMAAVYDNGKESGDAKKLHTFLTAAESACDGEHFVGGYLSLADVAMFHALNTMVELQPTSLDDYAKLSAFVKSFASQPAVAAYLDSPRRVPLTHNELKKPPSQTPKGLAGYEFIKPPRVGTYATLWQGP